MARPRKRNLDERQRKLLDILCKAQVNSDDICEALEMPRATLDRAIKDIHGMTLDKYRERKRGAGRAALQAKQFEMAMQGDKTMLIWLGKQWLGQRDYARQEPETPKLDGEFSVVFT